MKQLIEYKLWAGQIPYFVEDPLGGVYSDCDCKHYGISKDTDNSYLPDTVRILTVDELADIVQGINLQKPDDESGNVPMDSAEKQAYLDDWLEKNGVVPLNGVNNATDEE